MTNGSGSGMGSRSIAAGAGPTGVAVRTTVVPHPAGASSTVPLARSPSQATVVSGSTRVMRISPNSERCLRRVSSLLTSAHNSGGDFTRRRCAVDCSMAGVFARPAVSPARSAAAIRRPAS